MDAIKMNENAMAKVIKTAFVECKHKKYRHTSHRNHVTAICDKNQTLATKKNMAECRLTTIKCGDIVKSE